MNGRSKKIERNANGVNDLELMIGKRKEGVLKGIKIQNGEIVIGLCVGYKPKKSGTPPSAYFRTIVKYLKEELVYNNFSICLFPNQFNTVGVDEYLEEIRDLLSDPFLDNKVFAQGGLDRVGIKLPDYTLVNEENWKHAAEAFDLLQKKDPEINRLLTAAVQDYLGRNPTIDPDKAVKVKEEEVIFCIANMLRGDEPRKAKALLDTDENLPAIMQYVMTQELPAKMLQRVPGSLPHITIAVGHKPNKVITNPLVQTSSSHNDGSFSGDPSDERKITSTQDFFNRKTNIESDKALPITLELSFGLIERGLEPRAVGEFARGFLGIDGVNSTALIKEAFLSREKTVHTPPRHSPEYSPKAKRHESAQQSNVVQNAPVTQPPQSPVATVSRLGFLGSNNALPVPEGKKAQETPAPMVSVSSQAVKVK